MVGFKIFNDSNILSFTLYFIHRLVKVKNMNNRCILRPKSNANYLKKINFDIPTSVIQWGGFIAKEAFFMTVS